ncbi:MAG: hypothetical protein APF80_17110 [Alphaproteobacteria bacterium BRH_c36]|nr:MAG: hypothetical protein APF80_17110 [Alphaproteobacteria bacterium BRH_c36]
MAVGVSLFLFGSAASAAPVAPASKASAPAAADGGVGVGLPVVQVAKKRPRSAVRRSVRRSTAARRTIRRGRIVRRGLTPRHRYYRRRALNRGIGVAIGIGIIALIARESANSAFQAAMRRCARDYRSFDWETGTYVTYGGDIRLCPYLRPYL